MTVTIIRGDCRDVLKTLPDQSVQCCVTSPPYFGLRNYGVNGQIGLEATPDEFVAEMVAVFREVRRVLRDDGTLWLNLGDSYSGSRCGPQGSFGEMADRSIASQRVMRRDDGNHKARPGAKPKDLLGIPWMVAFALRADGWYLRSDIIWAKPNPMPESVTDRPTSAHEHVFLLTKRPSYFYDAETIREEGTIPAGTLGAKGSAERSAMPGVNSRPPEYKVYSGTRNTRNVWTIATSPFPEAHFATFPPALAERCIKAGTSEKGACPTCGSPWGRKIEMVDTGRIQKMADGWDTGAGAHGSFHRSGREAGERNKPVLIAETKNWQPSCDCPTAPPAPCVVLDPFAGAFTTAIVADRLQRDCIGIELNPEYVEMARRRLHNDAGMFAEVN